MTAKPKPLPQAHREILTKFYEAGGAGEMTSFPIFSVLTGKTKHQMPGDANAWIRLVGKGYVAGEEIGERDMLILTEAGRAEAEKELAGRVKEAAV